jgi:hypothetical protein
VRYGYKASILSIIERFSLGRKNLLMLHDQFGIAVLAYLLLIHACHEEILPGTSWSIAQLQHALRLRIITNQVEHNVKTRLPKVCKVA